MTSIRFSINEFPKHLSIGILLFALLHLLNIFIGMFLLVVTIQQSESAYTNVETHLLGVILCVQIALSVFYLNGRSMAMHFCLALAIVPFYCGRLLTLLFFESSPALARFNLSVSEVNFAFMTFIAIFACFQLGVVVGDILAKPVRQVHEDMLSTRFFTPFIASTLMALIIQVHFVSNYPLLSYFNFQAVFPLAIAFWISHIRKTTMLGHSLIIVTFASVINIGLQGNSRAAFFDVYIIALLVLAAVNPTMSWGWMRRPWNKISIFLMAFALPVIAVWNFFVSTNKKTDKNFSEAIPNCWEAEVPGSCQWAFDYFVLLTERIGFLDFSLDIIANAASYSAVLNLEYYLTSIVDNVLTPGFDIYDVPTATNALVSIYAGNLAISKSNMPLGYHSDQFGLFAELFVLFQWWSLAIAFFLGVILTMLFIKSQSLGFATRVMVLTFIVICFYGLLNSFGIDRFLQGLIINVFSILIIFSLAGVFYFCFHKIGRGSLKSSDCSET